MCEGENFRDKLEVWARIDNGTAGPEDHALAMAWGEQHYLDALNKAGPVERWMMTKVSEIMEAWPFPPSENSECEFSNEQILLFAALYGKSDIEMGGLEQFFGNHTGDFAQETADGLELLQATAASRVIRDAMRLFGDSYPREQLKRCEMLSRLSGDLTTLSASFFDSLPSESDLNGACEKLLHKAEHGRKPND